MKHRKHSVLLDMMTLLTKIFVVFKNSGISSNYPSDCGMTERELLLVDEAHLVGYLQGLANCPLVWGRKNPLTMRMASLRTLSIRRL